ncbi:MAG: hypothetical protein WAO76_12500 [Georgfuchsia sp.]
MNDLHNSSHVRRVLPPAAAGTTGTGRTGKIIDRQGFGGVEFVIDYGAATATAYAVGITVLHGDVTGTMTSAADTDLLGTEAYAGLAAGAKTSGLGKNIAKAVGYKGAKRYVTVKAVPTGAATGIVGVTALLHSPNVGPCDNTAFGD